MNNSELCKQIVRECGVGITYEQMKQIMATMWRIMIEELLSNPQEAEVMFTGIGKFDMKLRRYNVFPRKEDGTFTGERELKPFWQLRFHPSLPVREVINSKRDIKELELGFKPLYFDKENKLPSRKKLNEGRRRLREIQKDNLIRQRRQDYIDNMERAEKIDFNQRLPEE